MYLSFKTKVSSRLFHRKKTHPPHGEKPTADKAETWKSPTQLLARLPLAPLLSSLQRRHSPPKSIETPFGSGTLVEKRGSDDIQVIALACSAMGYIQTSSIDKLERSNNLTSRLFRGLSWSKSKQVDERQPVPQGLVYFPHLDIHGLASISSTQPVGSHVHIFNTFLYMVSRYLTINRTSTKFTFLALVPLDTCKQKPW